MDLSTLHYEDLCNRVAEQLKRKLGDMPTPVASTVEDELIPLLEWAACWEPSDAEMMSAFGTKWSDAL